MNTKSKFYEEYRISRASNASYGPSHIRNGGRTTLKKWLPDEPRCGDSAINSAAFLCAATPLSNNDELPGIYSRINSLRKELVSQNMAWLIKFSGIKTEIAAAKQFIKEKTL